MAGPTIQLGMDVTDVKAGVSEFINAMNGASDSTVKLFEKMSQQNKAGETVRKTIIGIADDGTRMIATLKKVGDAWDIVNIKTVAASKAINAAAKAQIAASVAAQLAASTPPPSAPMAPSAALAALQASGAGGGATPPPTTPAGGASGGFPNLPNFRSVKQIQADIDAMNASANKSNSIFLSMTQILRQLESILIRQIFTGFQTEIINAVSAAQQLSIAIAEIQTISQKSGISTQEWGQQISALANQFGNTQADVAEAAYQSLSNQVTKGRDTFEFLGTAQKFAATTQASVTESVNLLSSAIRTFRIPVQEAERVASIFFKTIELGRVRAKDMADTFGRVGAPAAELGVKLEEVGAGIATLTDRGIKFNDASTLLSNILFKLNRPTEAMKELFKEWGVTSGQAAIATFGFSGVLSRLNVEAEKGPERLGELFNQIRGLRGAFNFSGTGLQDFQENLEKITQGSGEYDKAFQIIMKSPGKQLQIEIQKIKTYFIDGFGAELLDAILRVRDALKMIGIESFADGISKVIAVVKTAATAFIVYNAVVVAGSIVTGTYAAATTGAATAQGLWSLIVQKTTLDLAALNAAILASPVGAFAAAFTAAFIAGQLLEGLLPKVKMNVDAVAASFSNLNRINAQKKFLVDSQPQIKINNDITENTRENYDMRFKVVLDFANKVNRLMAGLRQRAVDGLKATTEALKVSSKGFMDTITNNVTELGRQVSETRELIKASLKVSEDIPRQAANRSFDTKFKYASEGNIDPISGIVVGEQKIDLIKKKLLDTMDEARRKAADGTKESFEESRKLFGDAEKLQQQLFDQQTSLQRRNFEEAAKRGQITPTSVNPFTGEKRFEFTVQTVEYERQSNKLAEERLAIEERFRASQKQRQKDLEAEIEKEKERLRNLQQAFSQLEKLSIFNADGNMKKEFKGPGGGQRAIGQFDEISARIKELAGPQSFQDQFTVFSDLMKQRQALVQLVNQAQREEDAKTNTQSVIKAKTASDEIINNLSITAKRKTDALGQGLFDIEKQEAVFRDSDILGRIRGAGVGWGSSKGITDQLGVVKEAREAFAKDQTPEKAMAVKQALDDLNLAIDSFREKATKKTASEIAINPRGDTLADTQKEISNLGKGIVGTVGERDEANKKLKDAMTSADGLNKALFDIPGLFGGAAKAAQEQGPVLITQFQEVNTEVEQVVLSLIRMNEEISKAALALPAIKGGGVPIPEAPGQNMGGMAKYFTAGGYVGFVPRGSDRIPAMLGANEMVMNAMATSQFAPMLRSMNSGSALANQAAGSRTTNVGDINISVNGGSSSSQTLREIGTGLRRGIKRGQISL